jgi:hypothetical protein
VLDEYASYTDGFPAGSTVYFVPRGARAFEEVEKRYEFGESWSELARRRQVEFTPEHRAAKHTSDTGKKEVR